MRFLTVFFTIIASISVGVVNAAETPKTGEFKTSFEEVAPYAKAGMLAQRLMHGLVFRSLAQRTEGRAVNFDAYTVDPRDQKWLIYVPAAASDKGNYGVLVWYPGEDVHSVPGALKETADATQSIVVVPMIEDEDEDPVTHHAAMGLHGLNWVLRHYPVDSTRLVVGGSGKNAYVAQNLAAGFADIFSGAVIHNGGTEIGSEFTPVPAAALVDMLRQRDAALVVVNDGSDGATEILQSYRDICVRATSTDNGTLSASLNTAVSTLMERKAAPPDADCINGLRSDIAEAEQEIEALVESRKGKEALSHLLAFHMEYGGLAEEQSFRIADTIRRQFRDLELDAQEMIEKSARRGEAPLPNQISQRRGN